MTERQDAEDRLAELAPDSRGEYEVEVTEGERVEVVRVLAISPGHAIRLALEARGISARIVSSPAEHEEEPGA